MWLHAVADRLAYKKETENDVMVGSVLGFSSMHNSTNLFMFKKI
jgi:hypothetical protein